MYKFKKIIAGTNSALLLNEVLIQGDSFIMKKHFNLAHVRTDTPNSTVYAPVANGNNPKCR